MCWAPRVSAAPTSLFAEDHGRRLRVRRWPERQPRGTAHVGHEVRAVDRDDGGELAAASRLEQQDRPNQIDP